MARAAAIQSVQKAQEGTLGQLDLPTGVQPEATPQPQQEAAPTSGLMAELEGYQPTPEETLQAEIDTQAAVGEALPEIQQEVERQRVPSILERAASPQKFQRWQPNQPVINSRTADGGLKARSDAMSDAIAAGQVKPNLSFAGTSAFQASKEGVVTPEAAAAVSQERENNYAAALAKVEALQFDAVNNRQVVDPLFGKIASAVVENDLMNVVSGDTEAQETQVDLGEDEEAPKGAIPTHATGNARIGNNILAEYQRVKGVTVPQKADTPKQAETIGALFKHMWAEQNPTLVNRVPNPETGQIEYQFTAEGEKAMRDGDETRKQLFPKTHVKPAKQPLLTRRGQLPGDVGENVTKRVSGSVPTAKGQAQKFGRVLEGAMENMAKVPNVVDKQRAKILFATALPVLQSGDHTSWMAEINNFGNSKLQSFAAAKKDDDKKRIEAAERGEPLKTQPYSVEANMEALANKIAQEVRSVAQERNGANYLSYNIQGFQGRITPQQSFFNPTTSKAVRFVTRNAVPAMAKPGSRVDKNLRQMYAMMLVPGADVKLPDAREVALDGYSNQLEQWGDRLSEVLDQSMTDDQYEAIAQAMEEGKPLNDPVYQQNLKPLALDPQKDSELISKIQSKGEDGPHFIDGLIDFAKYAKARRAGKPHNTYFNAYMDGKTNGLASNGIQLGIDDIARRTGVMRWSDKNLLDKEGDIRDVLKATALESIKEGWDGNTDGFEAELNDVARTVYGHRDMNKMITMTYGYGKDDFSKKISETISLMSEIESGNPDSTYNDSLARVESMMKGGRDDLVQALWNKYEPSLHSVMSEDSMEARAIMRSAAALHAATNQLMSITGPTGMDINLGGSVTEGYESADKTEYDVYGADNKKAASGTVAHYESTPTAIAERHGEIGGAAYGGSVVAPVQAMDAATVALTATGPSWDRMSRASGGNPYMHTIYDAFKCDAMGYDVMLEEVNKNWLNTGMKWNYLEETKKSTLDKMKDWQQEINKRDPNEKLTDHEAAYMRAFLNVSEDNKGRMTMPMLRKRMRNLTGMDFKQTIEAEKRFTNAMSSVGYPPYAPPEQPNVKQLKMFVNLLAKELGFSTRISAAINKANTKKAKLKQEIKKHGYRTPSGEVIALQYYAH